MRLAAATAHAWTGRARRFDAAEVWLDAAGRVRRVEIIADAFRA